MQEMVNRRQLYQDTHGNCVFLSYESGEDGKAVFACRRGTNTFKPFYGDVEGCDYSKCFYFDNQAEKLKRQRCHVGYDDPFSGIQKMELLGPGWYREVDGSHELYNGSGAQRDLDRNG